MGDGDLASARQNAGWGRGAAAEPWESLQWKTMTPRPFSLDRVEVPQLKIPNPPPPPTSNLQ